MERLRIATSGREEMVNITDKVRQLLSAKDWREGTLVLWCPHTTGALTVNEAADPDVARDIVASLAGLAPHKGDYLHAEGNSDAHIKSSLFGPSLTVIVSEGRLQLGAWQGLFFCEFDGPRQRSLWLQWLPGE